MYNLYRDMKNKYKLKRDDNMYLNYIEDVTSCMFEWDEKIWRPTLLDRMIRDAGMAALIKTDTSDYTPVWFNAVDNGGGRYADGWFKDAVCFDFRGKEYHYKDWYSNPDILVFFNNLHRIPDCFSDKYATALSDIDLSIMNNVHYSRLHPIPVARDKKTANRIDQCIRDVANGDFNTILMDAGITDWIDGEEGITLVNVTDVTKSEYIQWLSHLHDAYVSRLFFLLGLGTTDNGKQAQITIDELNKNNDASITQALAWYNARKQGFKEAKDKGHDLSFDFSEVWKQRISKILGEGEENVESITTEEEEVGTEEEGDEEIEV